MTKVRPLMLATTSRIDFVKLFSTLADGIPAHCLHQKDNVPVILIKGIFSGGKSLAVESMMKTWSDDHTADDVLHDEKPCMFLENNPCDAGWTVSRDFHVAGLKTRMAFNSSGDPSLGSSETAEIVQAADVKGGAVFLSENGFAPDDPSQQWISIAIDKPIMSDRSEWKRILQIKLHQTALLKDDRFKSTWSGMAATWQKQRLRGHDLSFFK